MHEEPLRRAAWLFGQSSPVILFVTSFVPSEPSRLARKIAPFPPKQWPPAVTQVAAPQKLDAAKQAT